MKRKKQLFTSRDRDKDRGGSLRDPTDQELPCNLGSDIPKMKLHLVIVSLHLGVFLSFLKLDLFSVQTWLEI